MRQAASVKPRTVPAARSLPMPPPVGGVNALDSISDMPASDALILDNFFPEPDFVELRRGYESHATGLGGAIESLLQWAGPTSEKLFGAVTASIFDVTSSGAVGAADLTGLTNGRWQQLMQATVGGNFLVIANGQDSVRNYDGTTWTTPTITGVTSSTLDNLWLFKERIFFVEAGTLSAWYLATKAISGTATELPLGSVFKKGGKLLAGGTITRDGGAGSDDLCVFVSSRGEVLLFQGTDPASTSTWALIGSFEIPPPIGKRFLQKAGGDLSVITEGGIISILTMFELDRAAQQKAAITSKINRLFTADARAYRSNHGWQVLSYPRNNSVIVNIPTSEGASQRQWVMNALTGSWCRFTNMNAGCWSLFNEDLYFGGNDGVVYKADSTFQDNGGGITGDLKTAFSDLGAPGRVKVAQMLRALFSSNGSPGFLMDINVNYEDQAPTSAPTPGAAPTSVWDAALWGTDTWTAGNVLSDEWVGASGIGRAMAIRLRVVSNGASFTINGFDILATTGSQV